MNRICNTCNIERDEDKFMKDRTVCKNCYNKNRRKNKNQQPKIEKINNNHDSITNDSTYENHANLVIGPRNVGKTYNMLKMLEKR